jgi:tetratricopeptide (TPR) repeat protein
MALSIRGITYSQLGDSASAIVDFSAVIEMAEAPVDLKAMALVYRGITYGQLGDSARAMADYSAVIELADAHFDPKALALVIRGVTYGQLGDSAKAMADFSAVIEMTDAPVDLKVDAMNLRGSLYRYSNQFDLALNEFAFVSNMAGASSSNKTKALFRIPLAMIPAKPTDESIAALQRAFDKGDSTTDEYGGSPRDILIEVLGREHAAWPEFVAKLIPIYARYRWLSPLGSGLTESIAVLDAGGFSESQLDLWNAAWSEFGAEYDELSIPLAALDAAIQVIKSGDDRPLFDLPLEIRKIVQPLLKNTLSNG